MIDSAGGAIAGLAASPETAEIADAAKQAFSDGTRLAAFTAAAFLSLGLLATISLGSGKPRRDDEETNEVVAMTEKAAAPTGT